MTNAQILAAQKLFQSMTGKAPVHLKAGRCAKREECSALAVALVKTTLPNPLRVLRAFSVDRVTSVIIPSVLSLAAVGYMVRALAGCAPLCSVCANSSFTDAPRCAL
jgi:hypothetical protein